MGNIFSNKSFMNRYFSAPKSTGPAKLTDLSGDGKVTQKDVLIGKGVLDAPKQPAKMQEQEGPAKKKADGTKMTKGERQADRASKRSTRNKKRAEKRIDRNEKKQDRISKNTSKSTDPEVVKSGQARIERAKKRVEKNKTVSPDYVSKKDKANIAKNKKNEKGENKTKEVEIKTKKADLLTVRQIAAAKANKSAKANKAKESEKNKKTINTKFEGGKMGDNDGDGKIDVNLVKDSKKEESGPAKTSKLKASRAKKKPSY